MAKNPPVDAGDADLISGLGRSPGEGNGNPPPAWEIHWAEEPGGLLVHGVTESWTRLRD